MHRILIVDEDEHLLWALEKNLFPDRDDLRVLTAADGQAGMEILKGGDIDLLVSDIKMPGKVDGFQLILRAKEIAPDARVVIMTTFGSGRIESFADRMGITHYIEKPFNISELRAMALDLFDENEGFQGMLSDLELTDIIQMLCLAKRSTLLHLKHRDHRGKIVFDRGELVHAEFDTLEGPVAVYRMLALRQGDIFMESDADYGTRTIRMGWQDLLLEAVRRDDEERLAAATRKREEEEHSQDNIPFASFLTSDSAEIDTNDSEVGNSSTSPGLSETSGVETAGHPAADIAEDADDEDDGYPPGSHTDRLSGDSFFTEKELQEISMASSAAIEDSGAFEQASSGFSEESEPADTSSSKRREHPWRGPQSSAQMSSVFSEGEEELASADDEDIEQDLVADGGETLQSDSSADASVTDWAGDDTDRTDTVFADATESEASVGQSSVGQASVGQASVGQASVGQASEDEPPERDLPEDDSPEGESLDGESLAEKVEQPDTVASGTPDAPGAPHTSGTPTGVLGTLEDFVVECARLRATGLSGPGLLPDSNFVETSQAGSRDASEMTARMAEIVDGARRVAASLDASSEVDGLQLTFEDAYVVIRRLGGAGHFHFAVVERDASLGVVLVVMRQFAARLESAARKASELSAAQ